LNLISFFGVQFLPAVQDLVHGAQIKLVAERIQYWEFNYYNINQNNIKLLNVSFDFPTSSIVKYGQLWGYGKMLNMVNCGDMVKC